MAKRKPIPFEKRLDELTSTAGIAMGNGPVWGMDNDKSYNLEKQKDKVKKEKPKKLPKNVIMEPNSFSYTIAEADYIMAAQKAREDAIEMSKNGEKIDVIVKKLIVKYDSTVAREAITSILGE